MLYNISLLMKIYLIRCLADRDINHFKVMPFTDIDRRSITITEATFCWLS